MRSGPLLAILLGSLALVGGTIGAWRTPVPSAANRGWAEASDRLRNRAGSAAEGGVDAGYAAQSRRFGWGATAALGAITIALGISAGRKPPPRAPKR